MSEDRAKAELEAGGTDLERRGRTLGIALFWLLLCYVIGMSSRSILTALFWPEVAPLSAPAGAARCTRELDTLERQLVERTSSAIRTGAVPAVRHWLRAWDKRALALSGGCGPFERTRADLMQLRAGIGSLLDSYERGPMRIQSRIRRDLESTGQVTPPSPEQGLE